MRILNFHGIGTPERNLEPGEERYWISSAEFTAILDRIAAHPDRHDIRITFDDGNTSDLSIAVPELRKRGLKARFFILAGRLGQAGSLNAHDVRDLIREQMDIGSHGVAHTDWTRLSPKALGEELRTSMAALTEIASLRVRSAAIPFGRYNASVVRALRETGYISAFSSDGGAAGSTDFPMPRTSIVAGMTDAAVSNILSGRLTASRRLRRWAGMAVKSLV